MRPLLLLVTLAFSFCAGAQTGPQDDRAPPPGIQGRNILDVKPEVRPDASSLPGYMEQDNAQRNVVQPGNNSPMWRAIAAGAEGSSTLPAQQAPEAGVLIQRQVQYPGTRYITAGEAWRQVRNSRIIPYGGALFLLVLGAIAIFHVTKGRIGRHAAEEGGARIERFTPFERSAHWANAIAFCLLAISGLVIAFGKFFLLPVLGGALFGGLTYVLKMLHNFAGPVFAVSLVVVFITFLRDNWPQRGDWTWLRKGGGMFGRSTGHEPPSHRFNAGEKLVFWAGVLALGAVVVASGLVMDQLVPTLAYERGTMQVAHMVHAVSAVLMMCVFAGHIYIGTIGMRGAYTAMRRGWVGAAWAKEHHAYWYDNVRAGKVPRQRSGQLRLEAPASQRSPLAPPGSGHGVEPSR